MFKSTFKKITKSDIVNLENALSTRIPEDYTDFLLTYNGGVVEPYIKVKVNDLSSYVNIDVIYGINTGNTNSEILTWTNKFSDDILESSLIIADTLENGFIILICTGEYKGVYYWDDSYHFDSSEDDMNTYFIADSFSDFLTLINECKNK